MDVKHTGQSIFVCVCVCVPGPVCFRRLAAKPTSLSPCHLILATPFPQHYKGPVRKQSALVQMKDRAWENDWENILGVFQRHKETPCYRQEMDFHFIFLLLL